MFENTENGPDVQVVEKLPRITGVDTQREAEEFFANAENKLDELRATGRPYDFTNGTGCHECGKVTSGTKIAGQTVRICDRCLYDFVSQQIARPLIKFVAMFVDKNSMGDVIGRFATLEDQADGVRRARTDPSREGRSIVTYRERWSAERTGFIMEGGMVAVESEEWFFGK